MTRINVAIPPEELNTRHLLAEHRELKRIPNVVSRGRYNLKNTPKEFTLGKGHVAFFYDKLLYLKNRYEELYKECKNRNFNVSYYGNAWDNIPIHLMNDYIPTEHDEQIIRQRIKEKLDKIHNEK
jgi:deoxyribonuclease (pyrimidine dimer)